MIHAICIKWGHKFSNDYVNKLFRGIIHNTSKSFIFSCFTDNAQGFDENINAPPLPMNVGTWFNKISLYNEELYSGKNQIFFFDLDTVITGNLDEIFEYRGDFMILRDFYRAKGYGSGLMSWRPPAVNHMWTAYTQGTTCPGGDQGWSEIHYPNADIWQEQYPEQIISYKIHIRDGGRQRVHNFTQHPGTLESSRIVCFHGKPMPHDVHEPWMEKHWYQL